MTLAGRVPQCAVYEGRRQFAVMALVAVSLSLPS